MATHSRIRPLEPLNGMLVAFAAIAGWIDALSFLELGKVFTSFQSGNLVFLGLGAAQGDFGLVLRAGVSLTALLAGSAFGSYLIGRAVVHGPLALRSALRLEWVLLVAFGACWQVVGNPAAHPGGRLALIFFAAAAMGVQGAAVLALRIPGVMTNAMTATLNLFGALVGLRARGAQAMHGAAPVPVGILVVLCASYVASAVVVGVVARPAVTAAVPAVAFTVALVALVTRRPAGRRAATVA
jgi:uncharacterized membrane protein YoaK (UPF0700 family)